MSGLARPVAQPVAALGPIHANRAGHALARSTAAPSTNRAASPRRSRRRAPLRSRRSRRVTTCARLMEHGARARPCRAPRRERTAPGSELRKSPTRSGPSCPMTSPAVKMQPCTTSPLERLTIRLRAPLLEAERGGRRVCAHARQSYRAPLRRGFWPICLSSSLTARVELRVAARVRLADLPLDRDVDLPRRLLHHLAAAVVDAHAGQADDGAVDERHVRGVDDPAGRRLADDLAELQRAIAFGEVLGVGQRVLVGDEDRRRAERPLPEHGCGRAPTGRRAASSSGSSAA